MTTLEDRLSLKRYQAAAPLLAGTVTMLAFAFGGRNVPIWVKGLAIASASLSGYAVIQIGKGVQP